MKRVIRSIGALIVVAAASLSSPDVCKAVTVYCDGAQCVWDSGAGKWKLEWWGHVVGFGTPTAQYAEGSPSGRTGSWVDVPTQVTWTAGGCSWWANVYPDTSSTDGWWCRARVGTLYYSNELYRDNPAR